MKIEKLTKENYTQLKVGDLLYDSEERSRLFVIRKVIDKSDGIYVYKNNNEGDYFMVYVSFKKSKVQSTKKYLYDNVVSFVSRTVNDFYVLKTILKNGTTGIVAMDGYITHVIHLTNYELKLYESLYFQNYYDIKKKIT